MVKSLCDLASADFFFCHFFLHLTGSDCGLGFAGARLRALCGTISIILLSNADFRYAENRVNIGSSEARPNIYLFEAIAVGKKGRLVEG